MLTRLPSTGFTRGARVRSWGRLPRHGLPVLAAAWLLFQPDPAQACGATPCLQLNEVQPADGSVGVPRNTELRALYFGTFEYYDEDSDGDHSIDLSPMRLVPSGGEPILLTGTVLERPEAVDAWAVGQHVEALAANTRYELQLPFREFGGFCSDAPLEWHTVSSFTTGSDEDHDAPSFAGIESVGHGERSVGSSTCGTSDVIPLFPQFQRAADDDARTLYNVYVNGQIARRYVDMIATTQITSTTLFVDCGSDTLATNTRLTSGARLELRAVDSAGNESSSTPPITIEASCSEPLPEPPEPEVGPVLDPSREDEPTAGDVPLDSAASNAEGDLEGARAESSPAGRTSLGCAIAQAPAATPFALLAAVLSLLSRRAARARR